MNTTGVYRVLIPARHRYNNLPTRNFLFILVYLIIWIINNEFTEFTGVFAHHYSAPSDWPRRCLRGLCTQGVVSIVVSIGVYDDSKSLSEGTFPQVGKNALSTVVVVITGSPRGWNLTRLRCTCYYYALQRATGDTSSAAWTCGADLDGGGGETTDVFVSHGSLRRPAPAETFSSREGDRETP